MINIDTSRVNISDLSGTYKTSTFHQVNGVLPYSSDKTIRVKGQVLMKLKDLPPFIDLKGVKFKEGVTEGAAEVKPDGELPPLSPVPGGSPMCGQHGRTPLFRPWVHTGSKNDEITFDPLIVGKDDTQLACRGSWNKENLDFFVKGALNVEHLNPFIKVPFAAAGGVYLDGRSALRTGLLDATAM